LGYPSMKIRGEPLYHFVFFFVCPACSSGRNRGHTVGSSRIE
jgi:hypothetical protein